MKKSRVVSIIGYVMILIGIIGVAWGLQPSRATTSGSIPSGYGYYGYTKASMWLYGHWSGEFTVTSGGTVHFYILDAGQYDSYMNTGQAPSSLFSTTGSASSFSVDLPTTGAYYMVFDHGPGYETVEQTISIEHKVSGLDLKFLIGGAVLLVIGAVASVVGVRMKRKEPEAPVAPKTFADVTMFEEQRKPPEQS